MNENKQWVYMVLRAIWLNFVQVCYACQKSLIITPPLIFFFAVFLCVGLLFL